MNNQQITAITILKSTINPDDISIRNELNPGDIGYIIHLHGKIYKEEYGYGIEFETYVAEGLVEFYRSFDPTKSNVWICEHDNRIVGFLLLMDRGEAAQLRFFLITKDYRGIGLGKRLMEKFMAFARGCGYKSSYLWTTSELDAAAFLYTSYGFGLTEEISSEKFGKKVTEQKYYVQL